MSFAWNFPFSLATETVVNANFRFSNKNCPKINKAIKSKTKINQF
jgi:hypothetical protein